MTLLRIALDVPLPRLFDYLWNHPADESLIGRRVVVPFGSGRKAGVIVELPAQSDVPAAKLRAAEAVLEDMPALSADWLDLARFCADYYQRPLGEVVHAALPPRFRRTAPLSIAPA
ncbi:MAG TPA: hypothetical protein VJ323_03190, partial [Bryobacteraceae bacterium]|nr:hypothetical protein [Bryobacteraceae bacterium]